MSDWSCNLQPKRIPARAIISCSLAMLLPLLFAIRANAEQTCSSKCSKSAKGKDPCRRKSFKFSKPFCDGDDDWLTNGVEKAFGTDPRKRDTDGDGILDGVEINLTRTNPLFPDKLAGCLPLPAPDPTPAPCTSAGDTSMFGIPAGMLGNIAAGEEEFHRTCINCHQITNGVPKGSGRDFAELKAVTAGMPMNLRLEDQSLAHLVAYLNLTADMCETPAPQPTVPGMPTATPDSPMTPPGPTPTLNADSTPSPPPSHTITPTPTSTPSGATLYAQYCQGCHGNQSSLGSVSLNALNSAIQQKPQMQSLNFLTSEQRSLIVNYINSN